MAATEPQRSRRRSRLPGASPTTVPGRGSARVTTSGRERGRSHTASLTRRPFRFLSARCTRRLSPGRTVRTASAAARGEDHRAATPCAPGPAGRPQRGPGRAIAQLAHSDPVRHRSTAPVPARRRPRAALEVLDGAQRQVSAASGAPGHSSSSTRGADGGARRGAMSATTAGSRRSAGGQSPSSPYHHMIRASDSGDVITYLTAGASTTRSSSQGQRRPGLDAAGRVPHADWSDRPRPRPGVPLRRARGRGPTPGMFRERAFELPILWSGRVTTQPGAVSGWHHHDRNESQPLRRPRRAPPRVRGLRRPPRRPRR